MAERQLLQMKKGKRVLLTLLNQSCFNTSKGKITALIIRFFNKPFLFSFIQIFLKALNKLTTNGLMVKFWITMSNVGW